MSRPLTTARIMPTILRLELDCVPLLLERADIADIVEDIGAEAGGCCLAQRLRTRDVWCRYCRRPVLYKVCRRRRLAVSDPLERLWKQSEMMG